MGYFKIGQWASITRLLQAQISTIIACSVTFRSATGIYVSSARIMRLPTYRTRIRTGNASHKYSNLLTLRSRRRPMLLTLVRPRRPR